MDALKVKRGAQPCYAMFREIGATEIALQILAARESIEASNRWEKKKKVWGGSSSKSGVQRGKKKRSGELRSGQKPGGVTTEWGDQNAMRSPTGVGPPSGGNAAKNMQQLKKNEKKGKAKKGFKSRPIQKQRAEILSIFGYCRGFKIQKGYSGISSTKGQPTGKKNSHAWEIKLKRYYLGGSPRSGQKKTEKK